jgi:hypothetical protein
MDDCITAQTPGACSESGDTALSLPLQSRGGFRPFSAPRRFPAL